MKTYIGIDFGTTNLKAALFRQDGTQLAIKRLPTPLGSDGYNPVVIEGYLRQLLEAVSQPGQRPEGIVVTGMAEAGLLLHRETKQRLSPIIPWFDERTVPYAKDLTPEQVYDRFLKTGLRNSFKYGIYKYLWCLDHCGVPAEETVWLSAVDYLVFLLTGEFVTDPTFAARTYAYDLAAGDFDAAFLKELGLSRGNFPRLVATGGFAGTCILPGWETVPVHIGGHDHVCAAFGMHLLDEDAVCDSCGTAETYIGTMDARPLTETDYESGCIFGPYPGSSRLFWMANISSSGLAVEWFREKQQLSALSHEQVEEILSQSQAPTGIFFLPALTGMGTPCFRQNLSAAFLGLRREHTGGDMLRAVVEGIGYQSRMILEPMCKNPHLLSVGGPTRSSGWMQLKSDVLGCRIDALEQSEATITGAIALMLSAQCSRERAKEFCSQLGKSKLYTPDSLRHAGYDRLYPRYRRWYTLSVAELDESIGEEL